MRNTLLVDVLHMNLQSLNIRKEGVFSDNELTPVTPITFNDMVNTNDTAG